MYMWFHESATSSLSLEWYAVIWTCRSYLIRAQSARWIHRFQVNYVNMTTPCQYLGPARKAGDKHPTKGSTLSPRAPHCAEEEDADPFHTDKTDNRPHTNTSAKTLLESFMVHYEKTTVSVTLLILHNIILTRRLKVPRWCSFECISKHLVLIDIKREPQILVFINRHQWWLMFTINVVRLCSTWAWTYKIKLNQISTFQNQTFKRTVLQKLRSFTFCGQDTRN